MRRTLALIVLAMMPLFVAFSFSYPGDNGWSNGEDVTAVHLNEIEASLDTLELHDPQNLTAPDTTSATSPSHVNKHEWETWFNIDGQASPVEGEGGSTLKTTAVAIEHLVVNLTETEIYHNWWTLILGGDGDGVAHGVETYCTGGSHAQGNEGCQGFRGRVSDVWLTAFGTVAEAVASGAGTQVIDVSGITEAESKMLGENKIAAFTGAQVVVDIVDAPPGTYNTNVLEDSVTAWSFDGTATGQGVWTLGAGEVTSSGVQATGWCFSAVDADYTDINSQSTNEWLQITAINAGTDTITTRWENQGYNGKTPLGYLSGEGTDEGRVIPCAILGPPIFVAGDFVADSLTMVTGAGFPGAASSAAFQVGAYAGPAQNSFRALMSNRLGRMYESSGLKPTNQIDGGAHGGRYRLGYGIDPDFTGSLSNLKDEGTHAWEGGVGCEVPGDCKMVFNFAYASDPTPISVDQWVGLIDWPAADWNDDIDRIVLRAADDSTKNLTLDKTDGWGQNGDAFVRESQFTSGTATPTDGSTACNTRDQYLETDAFKLYVCTDGSTDKWYGVQLVDTP